MKEHDELMKALEKLSETPSLEEFVEQAKVVEVKYKAYRNALKDNEKP